MWMSRNAASTGSRVSRRIASAPDDGLVDDPDARILPEQERQLVDRGLLVVGDEHGDHGSILPSWFVRDRRCRGAAGLGLRHPHAHERARAHVRLDDEPVLLAVDLPEARVDVAEPDVLARRAAREHGLEHRGVDADAVVLDGELGERPGVGRRDRDAPAALLRLETVSHGVLDERLDRQERHDRRQHLGGDLQRHLQSVAEPRALEPEVAVDRAELLGDGREVAVPAERVAREVGELEHELAGLRRVGVDERGDRVQRVVDEVGADLRTEGAHLGFGEGGARGVEFAELDLRRHPVGDLAGRAHEPGTHGRGERDDRPGRAAAREDRCGHGIRLAIADPDASLHLRPARRARLGREPAGDRPHRIVALDGHGAGRVHEGEALAAEQRPQVPARPHRVDLADSAPQMLRGAAREMERLVGRPFDVGAEFLRCDDDAPQQQHHADRERPGDDADGSGEQHRLGHAGQRSRRSSSPIRRSSHDRRRWATTNGGCPRRPGAGASMGPLLGLHGSARRSGEATDPAETPLEGEMPWATTP